MFAIMKFAFFELEPWEEGYLRDRLQPLGLSPDFEPVFSTSRLTPKNAAEYASQEGIAIFVWTRVDAELLTILPRLRVVLTMSTGYDHIDLQRCAERAITVCNVPHYGENTVAEHTFALILALSRKVHHAYVRAQRGDFSIEGLRGFDLNGKTLGVIGAGNIGLHVIRIARGFGMRVLAYDMKPHPLLAEVLGFEYADLDTVLKKADILSLHVPASPTTYHLINRETLEKVKRGALLINTARGTVVDSDALLWALEQGILAGAGLDVIEGEEFIKEERELVNLPVAAETLRKVVQTHLLLRREDVVFTPHIGFNSREALSRILDTTASNLKAFLSGSPENRVSAT